MVNSLKQDTMAAVHLVDESLALSLTSAIGYFTDRNPDYDGELRSYLPSKSSSYSLVPRPILWEYNSQDAVNTFAVLEVVRELTTLENPDARRSYVEPA